MRREREHGSGKPGGVACSTLTAVGDDGYSTSEGGCEPGGLCEAGADVDEAGGRRGRNGAEATAGLARPDDGSEAVAGAGFVEGRGDVGFDRVETDPEENGDLVVAFSLVEPGEDLGFARGEAGAGEERRFNGVVGVSFE